MKDTTSRSLDRFTEVLSKTEIVAGHNIEFDINIMGAEYMRLGDSAPIMGQPFYRHERRIDRLLCDSRGKGGKFKWPSTELHVKLFDEGFDEAHNAAADVAATARCSWSNPPQSDSNDNAGLSQMISDIFKKSTHRSSKRRMLPLKNKLPFQKSKQSKPRPRPLLTRKSPTTLRIFIVIQVLCTSSDYPD